MLTETALAAEVRCSIRYHMLAAPLSLMLPAARHVSGQKPSGAVCNEGTPDERRRCRAQSIGYISQQQIYCCNSMRNPTGCFWCSQ